MAISCKAGRVSSISRFAGDGIAPRTFRGSANELDKLMTDAAGYVYAQLTCPYSGPISLLNRGGSEEAAPRFSRDALAGADKADRPYLLNTWANATGLYRQVARGAAAVSGGPQLKSDYWVAHNNVMNTLWALGEEENARKAGETMRRIAGGRPGRAPETYYQNIDVRIGTVDDGGCHGGRCGGQRGRGIQRGHQRSTHPG